MPGDCHGFAGLNQAPLDGSQPFPRCFSVGLYTFCYFHGGGLLAFRLCLFLLRSSILPHLPPPLLGLGLISFQELFCSSLHAVPPWQFGLVRVTRRLHVPQHHRTVCDWCRLVESSIRMAHPSMSIRCINQAAIYHKVIVLINPPTWPRALSSKAGTRSASRESTPALRSGIPTALDHGRGRATHK